MIDTLDIDNIFKEITSQLEKLCKENSPNGIDKAMKDAVSAYQKKSSFSRWYFRNFTDKHILEKVTAIACSEALAITNGMHTTLEKELQKLHGEFYEGTEGQPQVMKEAVFSGENIKRGKATLSTTQQKLKDEVIARGFEAITATLSSAQQLNQSLFSVKKPNTMKLSKIIGLLTKSKSDLVNKCLVSIKEISDAFQISILNRSSKKAKTNNTAPYRLIEEPVKQDEVNLILELKSKLSEDQLDIFEDQNKGLLDPISKELMTDPVTWSGDKKIYERSMIKKWFNQINGELALGRSLKSPLTGKEVSLTKEGNIELISNTELQDEIIDKLNNMIANGLPNTQEGPISSHRALTELDKRRLELGTKVEEGPTSVHSIRLN